MTPSYRPNTQLLLGRHRPVSSTTSVWYPLPAAPPPPPPTPPTPLHPSLPPSSPEHLNPADGSTSKAACPGIEFPAGLWTERGLLFLQLLGPLIWARNDRGPAFRLCLTMAKWPGAVRVSAGRTDGAAKFPECAPLLTARVCVRRSVA